MGEMISFPSNGATAEGYLANEVARGLQMSPQAVGVRMRTIYRKLQFDQRARAGSPLHA